MSVEWAIFSAIVIVGLIVVDRLRAIADRLDGICEHVATFRVEWEEDHKRTRFP